MSVAFLIDMSWKSGLVLAAALLLVAALRSRPAADKATLLRCALFVLPALPALSLLAPPLHVEAAFLAPALGDPGAAAPVRHSFDAGTLLAALYAAGVAAVLARLGVGLWTLRGWIADAEEVDAPNWMANRARLKSRRARLLVSDKIDGPMSSGWLRPVVLVDRASLARADAARPILAHEMAHIARGDWVMLLACHVVSALFWFNPLVWAAKRAAEQYAEEAADQFALKEVDAASYAQALLDCAAYAGARPALAVGMVAHSRFLRRRMRLILAAAPASGAKTWPVSAAATGTLALSALLGMVQIVAPPVAIASPPRAAPVTQTLRETTRLATAEPARVPVQQASASDATQATYRAPLLDSEAELAPLALLTPASAVTEGPHVQAEGSQAAPASAGEERQRLRWSENARRNLQRSERRMLESQQRAQAQANQVLIRTALQPSDTPSQ